MLASKVLWLGLTAIYYALLIAVQLRYPGLFSDKAAPGWFRSLNWAYALIFGGLGILLQGAISRAFSTLDANLWRPLMLCLGAALALLDSVVLMWRASLPMNAELWLSAVLGLALVAVSARALPERVLIRWYGLHH
jgi:hypothetical protein